MAVVTSYPGVYVEEVSSGVRPIAAAGTSTCAFVGLTEKGPTDEAKRITSWIQYQRHFGSFISDSYLAESVYQFFNNGGSICYVVRVTYAGARAASVTVASRAAEADGLTLTAKNPGTWGNFLYLQVEDGTDDPGNTFKLSVRQQVEVDVVPENFADLPTLEVHDNLSMDPTSSRFVEDVLARDSLVLDAQVPSANDDLERGLHRGGFDPILPLGDNRSFQIDVDYDGYQVVTLPASVSGETTLANVASEIQTAVRALTRNKTSTLPEAFSAFTCTVETVDGDDRLLLQSGSNTGAGLENDRGSVRVQNASTANAAAFLKLGTANGGRSEDSLAVRRPANAAAVQVGDAAVEGVVSAVTLGRDKAAADTLNETSYSNTFSLLDNVTDVSLLAVPGFGTPVMVSEGMKYCRNRPLKDIFFIGEMEQYTDTPDEAESFRSSITEPNSYGAVYFPWVKALDPSGRSSAPVLLPPSGFVAGLYARIDGTRGVWKAPAGTEATISGAVGLAANLTDVQHGLLNPKNVNVIRRFPAAGIVSWGARTVTSDPEWTYVPVRRVAIMLRVSIYNGIQWAVFEPNDEPLWAQLRLNIGTFMNTLFRRGAFQGATPSEAYFVKCDGETTTQADIDLGIVNVQVGFAPLKPAEFVVVQISQKAGQAA